MYACMYIYVRMYVCMYHVHISMKCITANLRQLDNNGYMHTVDVLWLILSNSGLRC